MRGSTAMQPTDRTLLQGYGCRSFQVRAESANEANRTVPAVLFTETPTVVLDFARGEPILEVLLLSGMRMPSDGWLPFIHDHDQPGGLRSSLGSIDLQPDGTCMLRFDAPPEGAFAEEPLEALAWRKVRSRSVRATSVGYQVHRKDDLAPGETRRVADLTWTAPTHMRMRISTDWEPLEGSLTLIGADRNTKIRAARSALGRATMGEQAKDGAAPGDSQGARMTLDEIAAAAGVTIEDVMAAVQEAEPPAEKPGPEDESADAEGEMAGAAAESRALPIETLKRQVMAVCPRGYEATADALLLQKGMTFDRARAALLKAMTDGSAPVGTPAQRDPARKPAVELDAETLTRGLFPGARLQPLDTTR